jgi:hypothetical protein
MAHMDERWAPIRGEIRSSCYRRVSHGLFLPVACPPGASSEWHRELESWLLVLPEGAVFTHLTAASLAGWWTPPLPDWVPVFAAVGHEVRGPRRAGLVVSRTKRLGSPGLIDGLPVDSPIEILLRCARDLGPLDMVPLIASARRCGHLLMPDLWQMCATGRPGVRNLAVAGLLSDPRAESAWEVLLHVFHRVVDIPVEPQVDLVDEAGRLLGRADLLVTGTRFVHEYDGHHHRNRPQHRLDLRRDRLLADASYVRRGYTSEDLLAHPLVTLAEMDRELGRRHRPSRIRPWLAMLAESAHSEMGRDRLRNRWYRTMGGPTLRAG